VPRLFFSYKARLAEDLLIIHLKTYVVPRGRTGFCEGSVAVESFESGER
jgi:hypothetical protein